jgi:hypothetical protein
MGQLFSDAKELTTHLLDLFSFDFDSNYDAEQGAKTAFGSLVYHGIAKPIQANMLFDVVMEQSDPLKRARAMVIEYLSAAFDGKVRKYGSDVISVSPECCEEVGVRLFREGSDKVQMDVLRHLSWDRRSCLPRKRYPLVRTFEGLMDAANFWKSENCSKKEVEQDLDYILAKSDWVWFDDLYNAQVKVDFAPKSPDVYIWARLTDMP